MFLHGHVITVLECRERVATKTVTYSFTFSKNDYLCCPLFFEKNANGYVSDASKVVHLLEYDMRGVATFLDSPSNIVDHLV